MGLGWLNTPNYMAECTSVPRTPCLKGQCIAICKLYRSLFTWMAINKPVNFIFTSCRSLMTSSTTLSFNQGTQSSWNCLVPDLISVGNVNRYGPLKITDYRNTHKVAIYVGNTQKVAIGGYIKVYSGSVCGYFIKVEDKLLIMLCWTNLQMNTVYTYRRLHRACTHTHEKYRQTNI